MTCILACSLRLTNHIHTPHTLSPLTGWCGACRRPSLGAVRSECQLGLTLPEIISLWAHVSICLKMTGTIALPNLQGHLGG